MVSRFESRRRAAFAVPTASHLSWRGKRLLTQASYRTLDAALCGVKDQFQTPKSRNSHPSIEFEFNVLNANLVARPMHLADHLVVRASFERQQASGFPRRRS